MPAAGEEAACAVPRRDDPAEHGGEETVVGLLPQDRVVEQAEHAARRFPAEGCGPQGVPGETRERRRPGALPADVTDDRGPRASADLEDVVEVAADVVALARRAVRGADVDAGHQRQRRRQQARLERVGDAPPVFVETGVLHCQCRTPRQLFDQHQVVDVVPAARRRDAQPEGSHDLAL